MAVRPGTLLPTLENCMKHLIVATLALALTVPAFAKTTSAKTTATHHKAHATAGKHKTSAKKTAHHKTAKTSAHKHA